MSPMVFSMLRCVAAVLALGCCLSGQAFAARLDDAACDTLKAERARLETGALKSDMAKGPQWAKDNLSSQRLKEIEQLIGLQESIAFRCLLPKPPTVQAGVAKAGADKAGKKKAAGVKPDTEEPTPGLTPLAPGSNEPLDKPAVTKDAKKAVPSKKTAAPGSAAKPAAKTGEGSSTTKAERPAAPKPSASKTKPKVSDAYVAPSNTLGFGYSADPAPATGQASGNTSPAEANSALSP